MISGYKVEAKSPRMFGTIILSWLWTMLYFNPRILALLWGPENILAKSAIISFTLLLDLFWCYALYHVVIIVFAYLRTTPVPETLLKDKKVSAKAPAVALLYTTYNDFQEKAVLSCVNQEYDNFHAFILDDSTEEDYKNRIDEFSARYKEKVTVIRREGRSGYKAGNINNALKQINDFEYFSISDADSILPKNYITGLLPYLVGVPLAILIMIIILIGKTLQ
ncbi:MAG: glycosyltransferase [Candidatus Omnitrophica bacterium]|nr:glycosyltransferase [Candidatus Omnitrophota bacterium]MBU4477730.1 glycosyltransferase [Candidatus Omnitrophota bacterium]MCG2703022.1 glycosyltransferase [Candidatus Omnitrophota bacterium]